MVSTPLSEMAHSYAYQMSGKWRNNWFRENYPCIYCTDDVELWFMICFLLMVIIHNHSVYYYEHWNCFGRGGVEYIEHVMLMCTHIVMKVVINITMPSTYINPSIIDIYGSRNHHIGMMTALYIYIYIWMKQEVYRTWNMTYI